jgi:HD-GYP domain-containing protein (c-di-GMP phosphodiesterase class II)
MRFPLQFSIAFLFTFLLVTLGVTLISFNYTENEEVALLAADDSFSRISRETATRIRSLYRPAEVLVDLTSRLPAAQADNYARRSELLQFFAKGLRNFTTITSLFVGYDDGEFFQLRALHDPDIRQTFKSPDNASYAVVSIEAEGTQRVRTTYFYDEQLNLITTRQRDASDYDPRSRSWYQKAIQTDEQIGSGLYLFHLPRILGATLAQRTPNGKAVVGADITMHALSQSISNMHITPATRILIFNNEGALYARSDKPLPEPVFDSNGDMQLPKLGNTGDPLINTFGTLREPDKKDDTFHFNFDGRRWRVSVTQLPTQNRNRVYLSVLVPEDELLADVRKLRDRSIVISVIALLVAILFGWWFAQRISLSLRKLAGAAQQIRQLKLDTPIAVHSRIAEVDDLAQTMTLMKSAVQEFIEVARALSAEPDFYRLLERLLEQARKAADADGGGIALLTEDGQYMRFAVLANPAIGLHVGGTSDKPVALELVPVHHETDTPPTLIQAVYADKRPRVINDIHAETGIAFRHLDERYAGYDYRCNSVFILPLCNRKNEVIGVLELVNAHHEQGSPDAFRPELVSYVEAMSSQAAIILDNRRLLKAQRDLLDSFIQLIAGAIDAKSAYTSGHCQRVPEIARMLAEAAHNSEEGPLHDFHLNDEEWHELHIASWLHDCGKVTTPEYVVDKATKLETLYNRIHEIRMRFEVLWRDEQIELYQALANGTIDKATLQQRLDNKLQQLREDFAFIAECNIGGEFMDEERLVRLQQLAQHEWQRYFSDRLGLSDEESQRKTREPEAALPAAENLLADKPEHLVERDTDRHPFGENQYGFDMPIPEYAYNYGELYNLAVQRGTLTDEERFKINEHITQTIMLLDKLPFPRELHRVPRWAGSHHEKLDGTGYPRRLGADDLSIPERIMAIADIFEALTASDRPYKSAKTLSESLRIMSYMSRDNHICPQLFELFLRSGVYRDYAQHFLKPEQIDEVDIRQLIPA